MNTSTQNGARVAYGEVIDEHGRVIVGHGLTEQQRDEVRALFRTEAVQVAAGAVLIVIGANILLRGMAKVFGPMHDDESEHET